MTILTFTVLVWLGSLAAGFVGSLTGLGGGVVLVPLQVLVFGVNIRYAIGASLVSVIILIGALAGARILRRADPKLLRRAFAWVIAVLALEMLYNGFTGRLCG